VQIKRVLIASAVVLSAACSDSTSPDSNAGALSFSFTGSGGGTFNVSGVYPTAAAQLGNANAAAGTKDTQHGTFQVAGVRAQSGGQYDLALLQISRLTVGTATIDANACDPTDPATGSTCAGFIFITSLSNADSDFDLVCLLGTGTITLTSVTDTHIQGTFSGAGLCTDNTTNPTFTPFDVTGGSFDVKLIAELVGTT
jgi:hypothetical protein